MFSVSGADCSWKDTAPAYFRGLEMPTAKLRRVWDTWKDPLIILKEKKIVALFQNSSSRIAHLGDSSKERENLVNVAAHSRDYHANVCQVGSSCSPERPYFANMPLYLNIKTRSTFLPLLQGQLTSESTPVSVSADSFKWSQQKTERIYCSFFHVWDSASLWEECHSSEMSAGCQSRR